MILLGDCRDVLKTLEPASVDMCVTSPPYWGLRDYGVGGQLGREQTPDEFIASLADVFDEVRRVLKRDGTAWVNIGDSYQNAKGQSGGVDPKQPARRHGLRPQDSRVPGLKPKDLVGIPWMLAFELRRRGWYLRSNIIWAKGVSFCDGYVGSIMPEAAKDRPTRSHEDIFLLSKSRRYFFDADAVKERASLAYARELAEGYDGHATKDYDSAGAQNPSAVKSRIIANARKRNSHPRGNGVNPKAAQSVHGSRQNASFSAAVAGLVEYRNIRSVWTIPTEKFEEAHFATFPPALVEPCIRAGSREGGTVLDPFAGSGTVGVMCEKLQRKFLGIELNPEYVAMAERRIANVAPLFNLEVQETTEPDLFTDDKRGTAVGG